MKLNKKQIEKITMFNKRDNFINIKVNNDLLNSNVIVSAKIDAANDIRKSLDQAIGQKKVDSSGGSPEKKLALDTVIKTLGTKARACSTFYQDPSVPSIEIVLKKPKTFYDAQTDEDIEDIINGVRQILWDNSTVAIPSLIPFGVNAAFFKLLDSQITDMETWLPAPAAAISSQQAGTKLVNKYIKQMDTNYNGMDLLVIDTFGESDTDFTAAFLATGNQISVGVRHNKVLLSMKNPDTTPINKGQIQIIDPKTNIAIQTIFMDAYGNAQFDCPNKPFYAQATFPDTITQKILFKPVYRGKFNLDFIMQPGTDPIAPPVAIVPVVSIVASVEPPIVPPVEPVV